VLLPISDAPNPPGVPWVTWSLIGVCLAIFLFVNLPLGFAAPDPANPALDEYVEHLARQLGDAGAVRAALQQTTAYDLFTFEHGYRPAAPELLDLLFSMFLHGGFLHLAGNMLFLWIYGDNVEHRLGRLGFLLAYIASGVAATLFFALFVPASGTPLVGASGAISGVLGFYFLWFPRNTVRLWLFFFPLVSEMIEVPARLVLGFYLLADNLLPFLFSGGGASGGVAHGAHIGGFVAGLGGAWLLERASLLRRPPAVAPATVGHVATGARPENATPDELVERGRFEEAAQSYFALDPRRTRGALAPEHQVALAGWLAGHAHAQAAHVLYRRFLRDHPRHPSRAEAHLGAASVLLDAWGQLAPAYQHLLDALDSDPTPPTEERIRAALAEIERRHRGPRSLRQW
jgi:membrane associated rhomboid family serine protease